MSSTVLHPTFLVTKEYRRFAEFCDACRRYRYIGLCTGPAGVGKTLSARHYTQWDALTPYLEIVHDAGPIPPELIERRTLFYTPSVVISLYRAPWASASCSWRRRSSMSLFA